MDQLISLLSGSLLGNDTVEEVAKTANVSTEETRSVLGDALPTLVSSLTSTATSNKKKTSNGLDLSSLLTSVMGANLQQESADEKEELGNNILNSLLGSSSKKTSLFASLAKSLGLSSKTVGAVLVAFAPMLLKKIGSLISTNTAATSTAKKKKTSKKEETSGNDVLTSLLTGGLTSSDEEEEEEENNSSADLLSTLAGSLLGATSTSSNKKKKNSSNDLLSTLAGSLLGSLGNKNKK